MAFCTNCGQPLSEGDRFCANCGAKVESNAAVVEPVQPVEAVPAEPVVEEPVVEVEPAVKSQTKPAPPTNYLPRAIVFTVLFWPTGIPAIIHAVRLNTAYSQGKYDLAIRESELAAKWCRISAICAAVGIVFNLICLISFFSI